MKPQPWLIAAIAAGLLAGCAPPPPASSAGPVSQPTSQRLGKPSTQTSPTTSPAAASGPLRFVGSVEGSASRSHSPFDQHGGRFITFHYPAVRVWDSDTLRPISQPLQHLHLDDELYRLSGDGQTVMTIARGEIRLWDVETSTVRFTTRPGKVISADLSPDGRRFVYVTKDNPQRLILWHDGNAEPEKILPHLDEIEYAQFNATGTCLVTYSTIRGMYHLWSMPQGTALRRIRADDPVMGLHVARFDPTGERLVVPTDHGFELFDLRDSNAKKSITLDPQLELESDDVWFSRDGKIVVLMVSDHGDSRRVQFYDASTGKLVEQSARNTWSCDLLDHNRIAICGRLDNPQVSGTELWDVKSRKVLQKFSDTFAAVGGDDETVLCTSPDDNYTSVWRLRKMETPK